MKQRILFVVIVFLALIPVFAIQKPLFMLYNAPVDSGYSLMDYLQVMAHGMKLDFTVAGYLTVIPLLCALISIVFPGKYLKKVLAGYFAFIAILIAAIFVVDEALYGYWGFRLDATLFFYLKSPKEAMASIPWGQFIVQFITFLIYESLIVLMFFKAVLPVFPEKKSGKKLLNALVLVLMGGLMFIPIRGGVTTSTANVGMVYFSDDQFLNHSAINPCFSLFTSLSKQTDFSTQYQYFSEDERLATMETLVQEVDTTGWGVDEKPLLKVKRPNVLVILLESFTANMIEALGGTPGVTPHLNKLSEEGVLFTNHYANSFRTDRGIVSILNGYLAQPNTSIMKYPAKSQTLPSIAGSLVREGYQADMLYGGDINFTNMKSYFYSSGYSRITSDIDFPIATRLSKWGANDDVTFPYLLEEIKKREGQERWMSTFLTLSSHEPFKVPYARLDNPYLNSVAFTDSCLGVFIDELKQLPVWNDLLVVLVADHGYPYPKDLNAFEPKRYHIPLLWLGGAVEEPRRIDTYCCQTDIAATLLQQMGISHDEFLFSKDIMDVSRPKFAFYTFNNGFGWIDQTGVSVFDCEGDKVLLSDPEGEAARLTKGKALLQTLYQDMGKR